MLIGKAGAIVVVPMAMVSEHLDHPATRAIRVLAMLERDVLRFLPLVGAPEEAMTAVDSTLPVTDAFAQGVGSRGGLALVCLLRGPDILDTSPLLANGKRLILLDESRLCAGEARRFPVSWIMQLIPKSCHRRSRQCAKNAPSKRVYSMSRHARDRTRTGGNVALVGRASRSAWL